MRRQPRSFVRVCHAFTHQHRHRATLKQMFYSLVERPISNGWTNFRTLNPQQTRTSYLIGITVDMEGITGTTVSVVLDDTETFVFRHLFLSHELKPTSRTPRGESRRRVGRGTRDRTHQPDVPNTVSSLGNNRPKGNPDRVTLVTTLDPSLSYHSDHINKGSRDGSSRGVRRTQEVDFRCRG